MAIDLGGIYVSFTGDTSKLEADIARAQALAKQGGADMSAAFNASAATAYKFSSAIDSVTAATQKLIAAQRQLAGAAQSSSQAAINGLRLEEAELAALFDLEFDQTAKQRTPAAPAAASPGFTGVDPVAIASITELGAASEASAVQVVALGGASTKAALPVAELGFIAKASSISMAALAAGTAAAAKPLAGIGVAASSAAVPLAAMANAAVNPAITTAAATATQLGAAVAGTGAAAAKATPQLGAMSAAQQTAASWFASLAGNANAATVATNTNTGAQTRNASATAHSVSQIQAASGAIRVFEGNQAIRAVERFVATTLGLGPALQAIFPIIGAIALGEAIYRVWEKTDPLIQAEKALAEATRQNDQEFQQLGKTLDRLNIDRITLALGRAAGTKLSSFYSESDAQADEARLKYLGDLIERTKQKIGQEADLKSFFGNPLKAFNPFEIGAKYADIRQSQADVKDIQKFQDEVEVLQLKLKVSKEQKALDEEKSSKETATEAAQTALAGISNQIAANRRLADAKRQAVENTIALDRQAEDAQIAGAESAHVRSIATAEQDLQIAQQRAAALKQIDDAELTAHVAMLQRKAAAESVGKDRQQIATVRTTVQGEIAAATEDNARKQIALDANVAAAAAKVGQVRATVARQSKVELDELVRESQALLDRNTAQLEEAVTRLEEIRNQANVRVAETQAKGGGELQQLQIQAQKIQLERQYGLALGSTLQQRVQQETQLAALDAQGRAAKIAGLQTELQIAKLAQDEAASRSNTALYGGDTKEATRAGEEEVRNKTKVADLQQQINQLTQEGNNASYEAQTRILELKRRESIAATVSQGAQQVPGAIASGLARGIIDGRHIGQDIRESLRGVGQELLGNVLRQVITQLIIKLGIQAAAQAALGAIFGTVGTAQAVATTANTVAVTANTVADTGLIVSNAALVAALIANTAALTINSITGLLPFAEGGRPPVGVPSLIGEKGPELWIPDQAGVIVPAGKFNIQQGSAVNNPTRDILGGLYAGRPSSLFNAGLPPPDKTLSNTPPPGARNVVASDGTTIHLHGAQFHGVQNVRELMREISQYAKTSSARFSPYSK